MAISMYQASVLSQEISAKCHNRLKSAFRKINKKVSTEYAIST